jgi:hypothetical protein
LSGLWAEQEVFGQTDKLPLREIHNANGDNHFAVSHPLRSDIHRLGTSLDQQGPSRSHGTVGYSKSKLRRERGLQIGAALLILCDTIRRMLEGTRPIDLWMLVIELLVLLLIAYEVGIGIFRSRQDKKRAQQVQARSEKIREVITAGQKLQHDVPRFGTAGMLIAK